MARVTIRTTNYADGLPFTFLHLWSFVGTFIYISNLSATLSNVYISIIAAVFTLLSVLTVDMRFFRSFFYLMCTIGLIGHICCLSFVTIDPSLADFVLFGIAYFGVSLLLARVYFSTEKPAI
ncbi:hypothetical protein [Thalassotalea agarivorans]|uniref:Uncharacterized protein n=1 Tax=Thalassotalea agarivorans TaxID=349064 RepID=A0A1I0GAY3_THASX|nr:hypothetical protein [Thalassotalea agarivorans]SET68066.1 hypothetical protein SAMN05660429_02386 [Thalassotalea agarivorans]